MFCGLLLGPLYNDNILEITNKLFVGVKIDFINFLLPNFFKRKKKNKLYL